MTSRAQSIIAPISPVLAAHMLDVLVRPYGGMNVVTDRGIFRRQPERIEPHREEHVVSAAAA